MRVPTQVADLSCGFLRPFWANQDLTAANGVVISRTNGGNFTQLSRILAALQNRKIQTGACRGR
jgi:hypothetical protein